MDKSQAIKIIKSAINTLEKGIQAESIEEKQSVMTMFDAFSGQIEQAFEVLEKPCEDAISQERDPCEDCIFAEGSKYCIEYCSHDAERKKEQEPMRDFTEEEAEAYSKALDRMYKPTGLNVFNKPCTDAVSREAALDGVDAMYNNSWDIKDFRENVNLMLNKLSPVPSRKGHKDCDNCKKCDESFENGYKQGVNDISVSRIVQNVLEPSRKGHWIVERKVIDKSRKPTTYHFDTHCSECGFKYAYTTDKEDSIPTNYCPNCGACMAERENEE